MVLIRLSPAQATGIHGWGPRLKTTLTWSDIEEHDDIDFDLLLRLELNPRELKKIQEDVDMWVRYARCRPDHAMHMMVWPAHPIHHLNADLPDIINLHATSRQLNMMGVTYSQLRELGMTPETMRMMSLTLQGWIDLGMTLAHTRSDFSDAQLGRVFQMTRMAVTSSFRKAAEIPSINTTFPPLSL